MEGSTKANMPSRHMSSTRTHEQGATGNETFETLGNANVTCRDVTRDNTRSRCHYRVERNRIHFQRESCFILRETEPWAERSGPGVKMTLDTLLVTSRAPLESDWREGADGFLMLFPLNKTQHCYRVASIQYRVGGEEAWDEHLLI